MMRGRVTIRVTILSLATVRKPENASPSPALRQRHGPKPVCLHRARRHVADHSDFFVGEKGGVVDVGPLRGRGPTATGRGAKILQ